MLDNILDNWINKAKNMKAVFNFSLHFQAQYDEM